MTRVTNFSKPPHNRFSDFFCLLKAHYKKIGKDNYPLPSKNFLEWFVGFAEGDGCFAINKRGDLAFVITQSQDNIKLLEKIKQSFGIGTVLKQGKRVYRYILQRNDEIALVVELFNGNLVLPSRKTQFQRFFERWKTKAKKRDLSLQERKSKRSFASGTANINEGVTSNDKQRARGRNLQSVADQSHSKQSDLVYKRGKNMPSLNTLWFLGFVEAEGCFTTSFLSNSTAFRSRFLVTQKGDDNIPVLSSLIALFGVGQIEGHSAKGNYSYIVSGLKNLENIYKYFDQNIDHFLGIKKESYLMWKQLNEEIKEKQHLDKEKRKICIERAKEINKTPRKSK